MSSLKELCASNGITCLSIYKGIDEVNPCDKWKVTISYKDSREILSFDYSTGFGHRDINNQVVKPNVVDVINCLIDDLSYSYFSFKEFCLQLGYNNDSIRALKTYKACKKNGNKLIRLLGKKLIKQLAIAV